MLIGICTIDIIVIGSGSLKGKRQVVKSLKDRIRQSYNVSIAEIDNHDLWQRVTLGIACVGIDKKHINSVLDRTVNFLQKNQSIQLLDYAINFL